MSRNQLPDDWAELAAKAGVVQSMGGIARGIGKPTSTISRMIGRTSIPSAETVGQVAQLLRVDPQRIWDLLGRGGREGLGRWNPPDEAHDFDKDAREALDRLIRVMAKTTEQATAEDVEEGDPDAGTAEAEKSATVTPLRKPIPEVQAKAARTPPKK